MQSASLLNLSLKTTAAISARRLINYDGSLCVGATAPAGATVFDAANGDLVTVQALGIISVEYGGTVAIGDFLIADATGRAVTGAATAPSYFGRALTAGVVGQAGQAVVK